MDRVKRVIFEQTGRDCSCFHEDFFAKTIENRIKKRRIRDQVAYIAKLQSDPWETGQLLEALLVSYSEFFRESFAFWSLAKQIIPNILIKKGMNHEIRIWSVGCSTGQEPYSIAMAAKNWMRQSGVEIKLRIFASDLSTAALERAKEGIYNRSEIKQLRISDLDRYFEKKGEKYVIDSEIKDLVTFSVYDIMDPNTICPVESIYGSFDVIFCRNLLIYYRPEWQKRVLKKLERAMAGDGYLITGEAETGVVEKWLPHRSVTMAGAIYHAK